MLVGAPGFGCVRRVAWANISLIDEKAVAASSPQAMFLVLLLPLERGCRTPAQPGRKRR